jgi:hypothetical protein
MINWLSRIVPAIRVIATGKVLTGDRSMTHHAVAEQHSVPGCHGGEYGAGTVYDRGFVDPFTSVGTKSGPSLLTAR